MASENQSFQCAYCTQVFNTVNGYVNHCRFHRNECNNSFPCPLVGCSSRFTTFSGFKSHLLREHNGRGNSSNKMYKHIHTSICCAILFCSQVVQSKNDLIKHLKEHIEFGTQIKCPFNKCDKHFSNKSTFTAHLSRHHNSSNNLKVSPEFIIDASYNDIDHSMVSEPTASYMEETPASFDMDDCTEDSEALLQTDGIEELYLRNLALFYLKLESKFIIPASTIQNIIEQLQDVHSIDQSIIYEKLMNRLTGEYQIPEDRAKDLVSELKCSDLLVSCSNGPLRTNHMRKTTYKKMFQYVSPISIKLGRNNSGKDNYLYYVPIKDSIQSVFTNKSVMQEYLHTKNCSGEKFCEENSRMLEDVTDGYAYKKTTLFNENTDALKIILYQDAFEVCNPLGSSKKKHKILAVYFTLVNFRPHLRYNIDHTLLVLLCKEHDFKYFGQAAVFKPLMQDLKDLENHGIDIFNTGQMVKGTVNFIAGDNLGSHCIGGFVENFSTVPHFCRYCLLTHGEFHLCPYQTGELRTEDNYNSALEMLKSEEGHRNNVQGIKFDSTFNSLDFFHVCPSGLPPCLGHDLFEGIVNSDVAIFLQYIIKEKKWFTYTELNRKIAQFVYLGSDKNNQPAEVNVNGEKLGGQAIQNWCLVRLLPLIISDKIIEPDDPVWQIFLLLKDIIEFVCAPKITESNIAYLSVLIDEYLHERSSLFPDQRLKPKHHYLKHYPFLILQFGPLIRVWTMRFESKHAYFKKCVRHLQNFKNLCGNYASLSLKDINCCRPIDVLVHSFLMKLKLKIPFHFTWIFTVKKLVMFWVNLVLPRKIK